MDGNPTTSLGNLFPCTVTVTGKKCFLMFRGNVLCFSLCSLPLVLSLDTSRKEPGSTLFALAVQVFMCIDEICPEPPLDHLHGPLLTSLWCVQVSLVLRSPELDAPNFITLEK